MGSITAALLVPLKPELETRNLFFLFSTRRRSSLNNNRSIVPVARLFEPAIFEESKLKVMFLGVDEEKHPGELPRAYTLTHCDTTSKLTLAISQTINSSQLQGWYNRLQRDEVVAEWKKIKGRMSLHVHCHISGGHFLLDFIARLRYWIFSKELPVVIKAFVHGDGNLFNNYPELKEALVWVYFHSNLPEFKKVECWGPLETSAAPSGGTHMEKKNLVECNKFDEHHKSCPGDCSCCFPRMSLIPWPQNFGGGSVSSSEGLEDTLFTGDSHDI